MKEPAIERVTVAPLEAAVVLEAGALEAAVGPEGTLGATGVATVVLPPAGDVAADPVTVAMVAIVEAPVGAMTAVLVQEHEVS